MIIDKPKSPLPSKLRGLHLFHFGGAPCAQRVRFVLGEKGFRRGPDIHFLSDAPETLEPKDEHSYVSRVVSLIRKEHLTPAYAAIQPNMVVPALVHDGILHIESVDIIRYLDETWPENPMIPHDAATRELCNVLVQKAQDLHRSIRYMSFRWSFGRLAKLSGAEERRLRELERNGSPEKLVEFYSEFNRDAISYSVYRHHLNLLENGFGEVEALLRSDNRLWLTGEAFSMADVMWSIKTLRVSECGYSFKRNFPAVHTWFQRVRARPSFADAIWRDVRLTNRLFSAKAAFANLLGRGIRQMSAAPVRQST